MLEVELPQLFQLPSNLVFNIHDNNSVNGGYIHNNSQQNSVEKAYEKTIESLREEIAFLRGLVEGKNKN